MISIIIPTLNEEKAIEETIESIHKLHDYEYEIIVSDGNSKDKTIEIAKKHGAKVVVYNGTLRQTIGGGRNLGASIATGEFFVFLDADARIPDINNFFKKALSLFGGQENLVGLTVCQNVFPEVETLGDKFFFTIVNYIYFFWNNIFQIGGSGGEFQMIKASAFKKLKGYNENIAAGEDNDMFQRLARDGKTRSEMSLRVMHMGRRAHKIGWPKLLLLWLADWLYVIVLGRSFSKVWKEVR